MGKKINTVDFISKALFIHKNAYDYSLVKNVNSYDKIKIICKKHGIFLQSASNHIIGKGCKKCGIEKISNKNSIKKHDRIKIFKNVHGDKYSYDFLPSDFNSHSKIPVLCKKEDKTGENHGFFYPLADAHQRGSGCPKCYGNFKSNKDNFIKEALEIEKFTNYNYDFFEYINCDTKGKIICPKHGEFWKTPYKHIKVKQGCPNCMKEQLSNIFLKTQEQFIKESKQAHKNKNYNYDLFIYKGHKIKSTIICPKNGHGKFQQTPTSHINGVGCPKCSSSKGESLIRDLLLEKSINFITQHYFKDCINTNTKRVLKFDFYLPEYNICIEYDGGQHFKEVKFFGGKKSFNELKKRDKIKNIYCKKNNIKLIRIKYSDNVYNIINSHF